MTTIEGLGLMFGCFCLGFACAKFLTSYHEIEEYKKDNGGNK